MSRLIAGIVACLIVTAVGCASPNAPRTTGSRLPLTTAELQSPPTFSVAVWGNNPDMVATIRRIMRSSGHDVIEPAQLQNIVRRSQLPPDTTDEAALVDVSKLAGADLAIFSNASMIPVSAEGASAESLGPPSAAYRMKVAVKAVSLDSDTVRWSGSAMFPEPVSELDMPVVLLTRAAVKRAACPTGNGFAWEEGWPWNGACRKVP